MAVLLLPASCFLLPASRFTLAASIRSFIPDSPETAANRGWKRDKQPFADRNRCTDPVVKNRVFFR